MVFRLPNAVAQARCNDFVDRLDAGTLNPAGKVIIYTGTQPANGDDPPSGTPLVTINLRNPAFGAAVDNAPGAQAQVSVTPSAPSGIAVVAAGPLAAGWYRAFDRDDNPVCDGAVTVTGGGGEMQIDNLSIADGATVTITSWNHTEPESA